MLCTKYFQPRVIFTCRVAQVYMKYQKEAMNPSNWAYAGVPSKATHTWAGRTRRLSSEIEETRVLRT